MIKQHDGEGTTMYKYTGCPACKSKKRHFEERCKEAIKMGVAKPGFLVPLAYGERLVADPALEKLAPLGTEIPTITYATEICKDCGCHYSPMVITGKSKKQLTTGAEQAKQTGKPKIWKPGDPV